MNEYKIKLCEDTISNEEIQELATWLIHSDKFTKGKLTKNFENDFCEIIGNKYSIFVNSGSSANLLLLYTLVLINYLKTKTIILPAISWSTTVSPAMQLGFKIHLCDCDKDDLGFDLNHLESLCKKNRNGIIMLVHVLGHPNKLDDILFLCDKYSMLLLEDTCEALGTKYKENHLGSYGLAGTFSMYYSHQISTIEGGMITTNDQKLYNVLLSTRSHGWSRDLDFNYRNELEQKYCIDEFQSYYTFYYPGFNFRPTEINSFLGIRQLKKLEQIVAQRQKNYYLYKSLLSDEFWCQTSDCSHLSSFAYSTLVENRYEVYKHLKSKLIETRPLVAGNIGKQPFWIELNGELSLNNADIVNDYGIYLPNHMNLSKDDIEEVVFEFKKVAIPKYFNN